MGPLIGPLGVRKGKGAVGRRGGARIARPGSGCGGSSTSGIASSISFARSLIPRATGVTRLLSTTMDVGASGACLLFLQATMHAAKERSVESSEPPTVTANRKYGFSA